MDAKLLKVILDDETLTDEQIAVLLVKAQKQACLLYTSQERLNRGKTYLLIWLIL